ncbi:MAG TPA: hypothetical protein DCR63_04365 [Microbacterium sp.]|nr:hypothetical protein [Microbacterium sp.]
MSTHTTAHGDDAVAKLRDIVAEAKAGSPLAPVTIIVRDNIAAISVRRALAVGVGGQGEVAGVNVTTLCDERRAHGVRSHVAVDELVEGEGFHPDRSALATYGPLR